MTTETKLPGRVMLIHEAGQALINILAVQDYEAAVRDGCKEVHVLTPEEMREALRDAWYAGALIDKKEYTFEDWLKGIGL